MKVVVNELRLARAILYLSTVSLQEILSYSRFKGQGDEDYAFLAERFTFLAFDVPCALAAARLAALMGSPRRADRRRAGPVAPQAVDAWQRDAAIAGTAVHHGLDLLVTCDGAFARDFGPHLQPCSTRLISSLDKPAVAPPSKGAPPDQPPSAPSDEPPKDDGGES